MVRRKDPYTVKLNSLWIRRRQSGALFELFYSHADGLDEGRSAEWAISCTHLTNFMRESLPFSKLRLRPDSILLCVKLTKENHVNLIGEDHALREDETPSFLVFLAIMPVRYAASDASFWNCYLAPLPQYSSHVQSALPPSMFHGLRVYRSITLANETFVVRDMIILGNSKQLSPCALFKIDVKTNHSLVLKVPVLQQIWAFEPFMENTLARCWYINIIFVYYGGCIATVGFLGPTTSHSFYLAIWTLCFMPFIYEIRRNLFGTSQDLGGYDAIILRVILVSFGCTLLLHHLMSDHNTVHFGDHQIT